MLKLEKGERIGPYYTLLEYVGKGSFGVVWLAERRTSVLSTQVALKIPTACIANEEEREKIKDSITQEAQLWARASGHSNVLPIIEADIIDGQVVIASEYAPDGSLNDWLRRNGGAAPSIESAVRLTNGILSGLEHLHSKGIIHRDLKPDNILLQGNIPRLADFGLSRVLDSDHQTTPAVAGTPYYMAPEVFQYKQSRSRQSDIWAVGVIVYQLTSGSLPFGGADWPSTIQALLNKEPAPLPDSVPAGIRGLVQRALRKDPSQRYPTAEEMRLALHEALQDHNRQAPHTQERTTWDTPNAGAGASQENRTKLYQESGAEDHLPADDAPTVKAPAEPAPAGTTAPIEPDAGSGWPTLATCSFNTVRLDECGRPVQKPTGEARYFSEDLGVGVTLEMVAIPGGTFAMGSQPSEADRADDEGPQHQVTLRDFFIGKFQVTQAQWKAVAALPRVSQHLDPDCSHFKGSDLPVETVSWNHASEFCVRLSRKTGRAYRLPTEAEWEYACRGGTTMVFAFGETISPEFVNYDGTYPYGKAAKGEYRSKTTAVGSVGVGNAFALYDMHGSVWEWCQDWYGSYEPEAATNPTGPPTGEYRVLRGGSWYNCAILCRSAYRSYAQPEFRVSFAGFRVVVSARAP